MLAAYADLAAAVLFARQTFRGVLADAELVAAEDALAAAAELLMRERYRIGFLGKSSFTKSSTLNRVVRLKLAKEGDRGAATTSIPTRFRPIPLGSPPEAALEYLTSVRFQRRRAAIAGVLGLACAAADAAKPFDRIRHENEELLRHLDDRIQSRKQPTGNAPPPDSRGDDLDTLARLLRAYNRHGAALVKGGDKPNAVKHPLSAEGESYADQLARFVTHQAGADPSDASPNELLWQVVVSFPTADISPEIDLIDLPGVDTNRQADDLTTLSFLEEFDGALVFQLASQVQIGKQLDTLYGRQDDRWPAFQVADPLQGRVWVVGTKADSLSPSNLGYESDTTFLEGWHKALTDQAVPLAHMLFVCNLVYDRVKDGGTVGAATLEEKLNLQVNPDGSPRFAPAMDRLPELKAAYVEVTKDGGIGRLRKVIGEDLRRIVGARIAALALGKIRDAAERLRRHAARILQAGAFDPNEFVRVRAWSGVAKRLAGDRRTGEAADPRYRELDDKLTTQYTALKSKLHARFSQLIVAGLVGDSLREQHRADAFVLQQDAIGLSHDALTALREWLRARFRQLGEQEARGRVALDEFDSPADALVAELAKSPPPAGNPFDRLANDSFFPSKQEQRDKRELTYDEYTTILRRQIDACAHEAARRCGNVLREVLRRVRDRLEAVNSEENRARPTYDVVALQALANRLAVLADLTATPTGGR